MYKSKKELSRVTGLGPKLVDIISEYVRDRCQLQAELKVCPVLSRKTLKEDEIKKWLKKPDIILKGIQVLKITP